MPTYWTKLAALLLAASPGAEMKAQPLARDFTQPAFAAAQAEGRTIIVETYAPWCLPCRVQAPILARLLGQKPYQAVVLLRIDEASPDSDWRRLGAKRYGSLFIFKGTRLIERSNATNQAEIEGALRRGL